MQKYTQTKKNFEISEIVNILNQEQIETLENIMLAVLKRCTRETAAEERCEITSRLLASGMTAKKASLITKIRLQTIKKIEKHNKKEIEKYKKTYKARLKRWKGQAKKAPPGGY